MAEPAPGDYNEGYSFLFDDLYPSKETQPNDLPNGHMDVPFFDRMANAAKAKFTKTNYPIYKCAELDFRSTIAAIESGSVRIEVCEEFDKFTTTKTIALKSMKQRIRRSYIEWRNAP